MPKTNLSLGQENSVMLCLCDQNCCKIQKNEDIYTPKSKSIFSICPASNFTTYIFMFLFPYLYYPKSKCFEKDLLFKNDFQDFWKI